MTTIPLTHIILSCRVRLARNFKDRPFVNSQSEQQANAILEQVRPLFPTEKGYSFLPMAELAPLERASLVENHLCSTDLIASSQGALILNGAHSLAVMLNEEDHLRIQGILPGLDLPGAYALCREAEETIAAALPYAFDSQYGYLTACPTNLGTGMRASVMLHLPALTENGAMSRISTNLSKLGLVIRGTYGEGSNVIGAMYQLSNQITLGLSEKEAVENLQNITMQLISEERKTRASLSKNINVQDKVGRSAGVLKNARLLSCDEYMKLISNVRFGIAEKLLSGITLEDIHTLTVAVQPATMAAAHGSNLSAGQRDILRADEVRKALKALQ